MSDQDYKYEYSAGGCVYKREKGLVKWLLGKHSGYHKWVLPKGRIEAGETATETALREVEEETAVRARIIGGKPVEVEKYVYTADLTDDQKLLSAEERLKGGQRRVVKYQEAGGGKTKVFKTVKFYLMEWLGGDPKDHDWEMEDAGWFMFDEAMEMMAFEGERSALRRARDTISAE